MSAVENTQAAWSGISKEDLDSKYEKCRNITEEIYKRINITFQIKKLETASQSDASYHSDQIDSNELSNETDLFACDKSDSIPSSTEAEPPSKPATKCDKLVNNNNNEETKKQAAAVYKRPRKKFRKRVKKRPSLPRSESDCSSDEALPLSRTLPAIVILTKDQQPKILSPEKKPSKKSTETKQKKTATSKNPKQQSNKDEIESEVNESNTLTTEATLELPEEKNSNDSKICTMCNLPFRSERGLRRHLALSHITSEEPRTSRLERREVKPA